MAVTVDEVAGEIQIASLAGLPVQLDQGGLHLRMPVDAVDRPAAAGKAEDGVEVVGEPSCHDEEFVATGRTVMGHRRLDQMARAVQLVPQRRSW